MAKLSLSNALLDGIILTHTIHLDEEDDELTEPKYSVNLLKIKVSAVCIPKKPLPREVSNVIYYEFILPTTNLTKLYTYKVHTCIVIYCNKCT